MTNVSERLDYQLQVNYFSYCLRQLPAGYAKLDTNRLTLVHFAVQALDLLGVWDNPSLQAELRLDKHAIIEWIYSLHVKQEDNIEEEGLYSGFNGGTFLGGSFQQHHAEEDNATTASTSQPPPWAYNHSHIAMTYTALCTLRTLGDDWSRIDKKGIIRALSHLQLDDGSFQCISVGSEHDMRFLYCATAISYMLQDWSGIDKDRACQYIRNCRSFDNALALIPGQEGHGGSTFTGIASLLLMNRLDEVLDDEWRRELIYWCVTRQVGGMQGRPNKAEDTCYSYWIGGTLRLIQADQFLDHQELCDFVFSCQTQMGGFSKVVGTYPDVLHSYYSMAYLSLSRDHEADHPSDQASGKTEIKPLNCTLGISSEIASLFHPPLP